MTDYSQPAAALKRVRFFDGQFLQDQDFVDEQKYHLDRERRLARDLGLTGVIDGLSVAVVAGTPFRITITRGSALDEQGRHLLLAADVTLDLPAATFASQQGAGVCLIYREAETDLSVTGGQSNRRFDETPIVAALTADGKAMALSPAGAPTSWDSPGVLLCSFSVGDRGEITLAAAPLKAGLRPPGPVRGDLSVLGHLAVGTAAVSNTTNWGRVLDVLGTAHSRLLVRTAAVTSFFGAHEVGGYGAPAGQLIGTESGHPLSLITAGTTRLTVGANGNVGVGVSAPSARLQVTGGGGQSIDLDVNGRLRSNNNDGGLWVALDRFVGGFDTNKIGFFANGSWALSVTAEGHVGVGTTAPDNSGGWGRLLDVLGTNHARLLVRTLNVRSLLGSHDSGAYGAPAGQLIGTESNHPVSLISNSATRLTVTATGSVGIGTATPASRLEIAGPGVMSVDLTISARIKSGSDDGGMVIGADRFVGGFEKNKIGFWAGSKWALSVTAEGNVGIGSTAPTASGWGRLLDVLGANQARLVVRTGSNINTTLGANDAAAFGALPGQVIGTESNHPVSLFSNSAVRLTVAAGGNIGIGTTAPGVKLQVEGAGGGNVDFQVNGRMKSNNDDGGLWVSADRFIGGLDTNKVGFFNSTAGWGLTMVGNGDIGIGTTAPENADKWGRTLDLYNDRHVKLSVRAGTVDGRVLAHTVGAYGAPRGMIIGTNSSHAVSLVTAGSTRMTIKENGEIFCNGTLWFPLASIANWGDDTNLGPANARYYWTAGRDRWNPNDARWGMAGVISGATMPSDLRLKDDPVELDGAVAMVQRLRGVSFTWNDEGLRYLTRAVEQEVSAGPGASQEDNEAAWEQVRNASYPALRRRSIGVIAQEVEAVLPEIVHTGSDGVRKVDYGKLTAVLVQAVKEQQALIGGLQARLSALEAPA